MPPELVGASGGGRTSDGTREFAILSTAVSVVLHVRGTAPSAACNATCEGRGGDWSARVQRHRCLLACFLEGQASGWSREVSDTNGVKRESLQAGRVSRVVWPRGGGSPVYQSQ